MPKEVKHIKEFMKLSNKEDMKYVVVKKLGENGRKFKLRGSKYLYTFKIYDEDKAKKLQESLPIELEKKRSTFQKINFTTAKTTHLEFFEVVKSTLLSK